MTAERHTIASAHQRMDGHEDLCGERYARIHDAIAELKDGQKWVQRGMVAVLIMALGWTGSQLWTTVQPHGEARLPIAGAPH